MSTLTFRNLRGDIVDIPVVPASTMKSKFGTILDQATRTGAVAISKHDTTKYVLLPVEEFESLTAARQPGLSALTAEFDEMLAKMQTPKARAGIDTAFAMSPAQLGNAAVKAAKRVPTKAARGKR